MEGEHESSIRTSNKYALPENAGTAREFRRTESRGAKDSKIEAAPAAAPMSAPARRRILTPSSSRTRRLPPSTIAAARRNKSIQQLSRSHFPGSESVQLAAVVMLRTCTRNHEHLPHTQATNPATTMTATTALKRDVGSVVQGRKSSQSSSIVVATCLSIAGVTCKLSSCCECTKSALLLSQISDPSYRVGNDLMSKYTHKPISSLVT